jgi:hypothetical protein
MVSVENTRTPRSAAGIFGNRFTQLPAVPRTDPLRPYFGSHSTSAVDVSFAHSINPSRKPISPHLRGPGDSEVAPTERKSKRSRRTNS